MFTGIVEEMGTVVRLMRRGGGARLEVRTPTAGQLNLGDSIAINGSCVTVVERSGEAFACDLVPETVARTNLGILQIGEQVNLEMPMRAGDRFGGHIVQGHVDCVGTVRSRRRAGAQEMLEVNIPFELTKYIAAQGSVAIDGVSLTVVGVDRDRFRVALIPHTVAVTTLGQKGQGASVNVEVDVLSKYVERHMHVRANRMPVLLDEQDQLERAKEEAEAKRSADRASSSASDRKPAKPSKTATPKPSKASPKRPAAKKRAASATRTAKHAVGTRSTGKSAAGSTASRPSKPAAKRRR